MKAQEFWLKFKELFSEETDSLKTARKYWKKPRDFTNEFINKYIPYIIKEQNDIAEFEYFRIDIIAYSQRKDEAEAYPYDGELTPYLWDLKVAFEHENNNKEWLDEVIKLSHINCPLRVVVGYFVPDNFKRDNALDFAATMLKKKIGNECANNQEFLLVIGDSGIQSAQQVIASSYTPYLYSNGKFIKQEW